MLSSSTVLSSGRSWESVVRSNWTGVPPMEVRLSATRCRIPNGEGKLM